ncbi:hypothetical protein ACFQX4_08255 [Roseomonas sp. GCM10028921]
MAGLIRGLPPGGAASHLEGMIDARRFLLAAALLAAPLLPAAPAEARGGVSFGVGIGTGYPYYPAYPYDPFPYAYSVPVVPAVPYVAPYPAYAPPARPLGQACYAGAYVCPLERAAPAGDACACPARGGQSAWGRVGG